MKKPNILTFWDFFRQIKMKPQIIGEGIFDIFYLITVITTGVTMFLNSNDNHLCRIFSYSVLVLGFGDTTHLVPRLISMVSGGFDKYKRSIGFGKFMTSITITFYYIIMFYFVNIKYNDFNGKLTYTFLGISALRFIICILPQNEWFTTGGSMKMNYLRNIPFSLMGLIVIYRFYIFRNIDEDFKYVYLAIIISFGFYLPVILFAHKYPMIGMLMIPKTVAYLYIVYVGYKHYIGFASEQSEL